MHTVLCKYFLDYGLLRPKLVANNRIITIIIIIKVKVKVTLQQVTKAQGGAEVYCTLSLTSVLRVYGWSALRPGRFTPGTEPVPFIQEAGWASGTVWTDAENFASTGIRSQDHGPYVITIIITIIINISLCHTEYMLNITVLRTYFKELPKYLLSSNLRVSLTQSKPTKPGRNFIF
jgi:hypothetical protein